MKRLPLGIQNFREIIEGDYLYVDKTQYIYNLINGAKYYFLSRPRRFGKSLLLDTIGEVFKGEKELFKGLLIYDSGYDFKKHPVIRLDMSRMSSKTPDILEESLLSRFKEMYAAEGFMLEDRIVSDAFAKLIVLLHDKYNEKVVVLIDEYDKPILDHINDIEMADANRQVIRGFYGILKSSDPYLRFTMLTGVSKFTKTSIFSELNNLLDITLMEEYANICGIAIDDLDRYFSEHISNLSAAKRLNHHGSIRDKILAWYDGYSWDGETRVINPFSLLSFFMQKRFACFWYASGTPTFLIKMIKEQPDTFLKLKNLEMSERMLDMYDTRKMSVIPLLFQTGYLTMSEKRMRGYTESYLLKMPNLEVRESFYLNIVSEFTENDENMTESAYWRIKESLMAGNLQSMLDIMRGLFASIPYQLHISHEYYYHSIFYSILTLLGFDISAEVSVSGGSVDAVLGLDDKVYVIEFKYSKCQQDASEEEKRKLFETMLQKGMEQIKERGYHKKYIESGKAIYLAAFAFLGRDDIEMKFELLQ